MINSFYILQPLVKDSYVLHLGTPGVLKKKADFCGSCRSLHFAKKGVEPWK